MPPTHPRKGGLPADPNSPSASSRSTSSSSNRGHHEANSDMTNAPSSPAWDTDWSLPGPPGPNQPPHHQSRCSHQLPATPRDASDEKQKKLERKPNKKVNYEEYVYCEDCAKQVDSMIDMHDSVQKYLEKYGESDTKEAKAESQRIARKIRPGLTRRANSRIDQEDKDMAKASKPDAGQVVADEQRQRNLERVKKAHFASHAEVVTKYRFDPDEEGVLSSSRRLVQRVQFRNGKELGRRRGGERCYLRMLKHTYVPGKFSTMDPLNSSFLNEKKYPWDDANFGHGEHLYPLDEDKDAKAAPLLPRTKPWDDDEDEE
ncbi:hypothetical protein SLS55_001665 [Diplodia seriata]|uniref:Uncharacterized protein n=1 Tax=Diplodia seriata TaxID=420778 RepID=A0ABR3CR22_9PEZI